MSQPKLEVPEGDVSSPSGTQNSLIPMGQLALSLATNLLELAYLESSSAVKALPKLMGLAIVKAGLLTLTWLSLCIAIGWFVADLTSVAPLAAVVFFAMQLLALAVVQAKAKRLGKALKLPHTRAQWNQLKESINEAKKSHSNA